MNESISTKFPEYVCHKRVRAAKILSITATGIAGGRYFLGFDGLGQCVTPEWKTRHKPEVGGYYVVYGIGTPEQYESYSPAKAFEEGYRLVKHVTGTEIEARWNLANQENQLKMEIPPEARITPTSPSELARTAAQWLTEQLIEHGHDGSIDEVVVSLNVCGNTRTTCKSDVRHRVIELAKQLRKELVNDGLPTYNKHPLYPPIVPPIIPEVPKPTIGRIVHYKDAIYNIRPAMILFTHPGDQEQRCHLLIFGTYTDTRMDEVAYGKGAGQWSWPEMV